VIEKWPASEESCKQVGSGSELVELFPDFFGDFSSDKALRLVQSGTPPDLVRMLVKDGWTGDDLIEWRTFGLSNEDIPGMARFMHEVGDAQEILAWLEAGFTASNSTMRSCKLP
jgi:hypothetical protein